MAKRWKDTRITTKTTIQITRKLCSKVIEDVICRRSFDKMSAYELREQIKEQGGVEKLIKLAPIARCWESFSEEASEYYASSLPGSEISAENYLDYLLVTHHDLDGIAEPGDFEKYYDEEALQVEVVDE